MGESIEGRMLFFWTPLQILFDFALMFYIVYLAFYNLRIWGYY